MRVFAILSLLSLAPALLSAEPLGPRDGWAVHPTDKPYQVLVDAVKVAAGTQGLGVVTEAGPTGAARARGIDIPGNRVIGLFNNDLAVRILDTSVAAMIEAPVRMYVTENPDGTATLAYKLPSHVFAPYMDEGGATLAEAVSDLDARFAAVADAGRR